MKPERKEEIKQIRKDVEGRARICPNCRGLLSVELRAKEEDDRFQEFLKLWREIGVQVSLARTEDIVAEIATGRWRKI